MKHVKSERLKKFESELSDLEEWLKLGLVPKKDIPKHKEEIDLVRQKIEEEKERLQFLRESGDAEDFVAPKKGAARSSYSDMPSLPDIDAADSTHAGDSNFDSESSAGFETTVGDAGDETNAETETATSTDHDDDEESYFSDKNRWKRGGIIDPDADEW
jgi:hypothetical protein